ncbi:MAG: ATP synthase F0 subunit B [Akkermansiaceae bacterium]|nr:ATP synthase F0 subunit B [Akkermansiaceae bacterium]
MNIPFNILAAATDVAEDAGVVERIQKTFHIHGPAFIAQCIAVLLAAFLLKKFAFGPVQEMLEKRRERIAEGEEKLKQIEKQLAESEATTAKAIEEANQQAKRLVEEAKEGATAFTEQKSQEAVAQAQQILSKAEAAAKADRERLRAELKSEFGRLVAATTSQVTGKVLTDEDQKRINDEALAKID